MSMSKEKPKASARNFFGVSSKRYVWKWVPYMGPGVISRSGIAINIPNTDVMVLRLIQDY